MSKTYFGIDVSEHNGAIDWAEVAKHIDFAILRLGWVGNKNNHTLDKKFKENYAAAKKAGVKIGAYVYIYSNSEETAKQGAEWAVKQLNGLDLDLPVYCDMEDKSIAGLGKTKLSNIAKAFNEIIEKAGFWAGLYANKNWFDNYLTKAVAKRFTTWIAHYTSGAEKYKGEFDMWQNSSTGKVAGINGNVDTDYLYRDLFNEIAKKKGNKTPSKPVETKPAASKTENKSYSNGAKSFDSTYKYGKAYFVKTKAGLRLRKSPVNGDTITIMPYGSKVTWYGYYTNVNGVIWRYVQYKNNGRTFEGFCSNEYLK